MRSLLFLIGFKKITDDVFGQLFKAPLLVVGQGSEVAKLLLGKVGLYSFLIGVFWHEVKIIIFNKSKNKFGRVNKSY
jgi:hypothetical protein